MGLFDKFKRNGVNNRDIETKDDYQKINNLYAIFPPVENQNEILNEIYEKYSGEVIPEPAKETIIPRNSAENLCKYNGKFYRIGKTSQRIADASKEQLDYIEYSENGVCRDLPEKHHICFTTAQNVLHYLQYGDSLDKVIYDKAKLKQNCIENENVYFTGGPYSELYSGTLYIGERKSLYNIETIKDIIKMSSDKTLADFITDKETLYDTIKYFCDIGANDVSNSLKNVLKISEYIMKENSSAKSAAQYMRKNIDKIIPDMTIDMKIAQQEIEELSNNANYKREINEER